MATAETSLTSALVVVDMMEFDGRVRLFERPGSDIRLKGDLKKLKTMKKKFFVLRSTSSSGPARLEYFDSEKKFQAGHLPKRSIQLHTCFNINRKSDSRHKFAIALYTKEECFSVIAGDEKEQEKWLSLMLEYQNEYVRDGDHRGREHYEHVWQVAILHNKGLAPMNKLKGSYRLCLTCFSVCLVKVNEDKPLYVFQLGTIRSLAHSDNVFRMEVGKIAPTGEGELWMHADDAVIAQNLHETILSYMKMNSASFLLRPTESRHRTSSESTAPVYGKTRSRPDSRPASVYTTSRTSIHNPLSPATSPLSFLDNPIMDPYRLRSDSMGSSASWGSMNKDEQAFDQHLQHGPEPVEEEPDSFESSNDQLSIPSSPGPHLGLEDFMGMTSGHLTPPTSQISTYIEMMPSQKRDSSGASEPSSAYIPMKLQSLPSAAIPIHRDNSQAYIDMSPISHLPTVKESGSAEGYMPMTPSYGTSPSSSNSSYLRPERVACMLSNDPEDFTQPHLRTYSLGSRPVKATSKYTGYMDMSSGRKGVSDNGRSCSAPHLMTHQQHRNSTTGSSRSSTRDSPTPSGSPLSASLKSDDSDSFMELEFYRPRTASDSFSYRPRASSFGVQQNSLMQGHRPRSSSHGQGTRPMRRNKVLGLDSGRVSHELLQHTSQNSSVYGSFDSLKLSSSESLRKLSLELRAKTSQLNNAEYIDMNFEKRHTPSPQPGSATSSQSDSNSYIEMQVGNSKRCAGFAKSGLNSKTKSSEDYTNMTFGESHHKSKSSEDYTNMTFGGESHHKLHSPTDSGKDFSYMNMDGHHSVVKKQNSPSRTPSTENVNTYILYEPSAGVNEGMTGSGVISGSRRSDSLGSDPRSRSGSGGKDSKKRSLFSLKHGSGDLKQSSRKLTPQHNSGAGGEKYGHDIRLKTGAGNKGSLKNGRKFFSTNSDSSKSFGSSRKTPTPPKGSVDADDEYIEFSPTVGKSDSDSTHSMGTSRTGHMPPTKSDYVGFEPGSIQFYVGKAPSGLLGVGNGGASMSEQLCQRSYSSMMKPVGSLPSENRSSDKNSEENITGHPVSTVKDLSFHQAKDEDSNPTEISKPLYSHVVQKSGSQSPSLLSGNKPMSSSHTQFTSPFSKPANAAALSHSSHFASGNSSFVSSTAVPTACSVSKQSGIEDNDYLMFDPRKPGEDLDPLSNKSVQKVTALPSDNGLSVSAALPSLPLSMTIPSSTLLQSVSPSASSYKRSLSSPGAGASPSEGRAKQTLVAGSKHGASSLCSTDLSAMVKTMDSGVSCDPTPGRISLSGSSGTVMNVEKMCRVSTAGSRDAGGMVRPDSTPCMLSMDSAFQARSRHSSGNSQGDVGTRSNSTEALKTLPGTLARHSITDLTDDQMNFTSNALSHQQPDHCHDRYLTQQASGGQLGPSCGSAGQGGLNYAKLDLASNDSMNELSDTSPSPRSKIKHSVEDKGDGVSYAIIDFEKSDHLPNSNNK